MSLLVRIFVPFLILLSLIFPLGAAEFNNPYKICVDFEGSYFIADTAKNQVSKYSPQGKFLYSFSDGLSEPQGAVVDKDRNVYVVDTLGHRMVQLKDSTKGLSYVRDFEIGVKFPRDIDISPDGRYLYILDTNNNRLIKYDLENSSMQSIGEKGNGPSQFDSPSGLGVDFLGNVYIADTNNNRVMKLDKDGNWIRNYGYRGNNSGEFFYPQDVVVGHSLNLFVADGGNSRIQRLANDGKYLDSLEYAKTGALTNVRGLGLDVNTATLYISSAGGNISIVPIGVKVSDIILGNSVFSPNLDDWFEEIKYGFNLPQPANTEIYLQSKDSFVRNLNPDTNEAEKNRIVVFEKTKMNGKASLVYKAEKKIDSGEYYLLMVFKDLNNQYEPAYFARAVVSDIDPPVFVSSNQSAEVLPNEKNSLSIGFTLNEIADVSLALYDDNNQLMYMKTLTKIKAGNFNWNGENSFGERKRGRYQTYLTAIDPVGNKSELQLKPILVAKADQLLFDLTAKPQIAKPSDNITVQFGLVQSAVVNLDLSFTTGKILKNYYSQQFFDSGTHELTIKMSDFGVLPDQEYFVSIKAVSGNLTDSLKAYYKIDSTPPYIKAQILPNPFLTGPNLQTTIAYEVNEDCNMNITVIDPSNVAVKRISDDFPVSKGKLDNRWDGKDDYYRPVDSGKYFVELRAVDYAGNQSAILLPLNLISTTPKVTLQSGVPYFTPNGDAKNEYLQMSYTLSNVISGNATVTALIYNQSGQLVKTLQSNQQQVAGTYNLIWDGAADFGSTVPVTDGLYTLRITATGALGMVSSPLEFQFARVAINPVLSGTAATYYISPVSSGSQTQLAVPVQLSLSDGILQAQFLEKQATAYLTITDINGVVITKINQKLNMGYNKILWDGKDQAGNLVTNATYYYQFQAFDAAQNSTQILNGTVVVDSQTPLLSAVSTTPLTGYSAYRDGALSINYTTADNVSTVNMKINIYNSLGTLIRTIFNGQESIGTKIKSWNGQDSNGDYVNDGTYTIEILLTDLAGNVAPTSNNSLVLTDEWQVTNTGLLGNYAAEPVFERVNGATIRLAYRLGNNEYFTYGGAGCGFACEFIQIASGGSGPYWSNVIWIDQVQTMDFWHHTNTFWNPAIHVFGFHRGTANDYWNWVPGWGVSSGGYVTIRSNSDFTYPYYAPSSYYIHDFCTVALTTGISVGGNSGQICNGTYNIPPADANPVWTNNGFLYKTSVAANGGTNFAPYQGTHAVINNVPPGPYRGIMMVDQAWASYSWQYWRRNVWNADSTNNGTTWSLPGVDQTSNGQYRYTIYNVSRNYQVSVGATIHRVTTNAGIIYYDRSIDNGANWTPQIQISPTGITAQSPTIIMDNSGTALVAWSDLRLGAGNEHIFMQRVPANFRPVTVYGYVVPAAGPTFTVMGIMSSSFTFSSSGGFGILSTPSQNVSLIAPSDGSSLTVRTPALQWQIPSNWNMITTNYLLELSPGNQTFGQVDDVSIALNSSQIQNNSNFISYTLKNSEALTSGTYYWRVIAHGVTSNTTWSFTLNPALSLDNVINYPNPFQSQTTIRYRLSKPADVSILIFDMSGQLVRKMQFFAGSPGGMETTFSQEYNDITFDGKNDRGMEVLNGVYFYDVIANSGTDSQRVRGKMVKWK